MASEKQVSALLYKRRRWSEATNNPNTVDEWSAVETEIRNMTQQELRFEFRRWDDLIDKLGPTKDQRHTASQLEQEIVKLGGKIPDGPSFTALSLEQSKLYIQNLVAIKRLLDRTPKVAAVVSIVEPESMTRNTQAMSFAQMEARQNAQIAEMAISGMVHGFEDLLAELDDNEKVQN